MVRYEKSLWLTVQSCESVLNFSPPTLHQFHFLFFIRHILDQELLHYWKWCERHHFIVAIICVSTVLSLQVSLFEWGKQSTTATENTSPLDISCSLCSVFVIPTSPLISVWCVRPLKNDKVHTWRRSGQMDESKSKSKTYHFSGPVCVKLKVSVDLFELNCMRYLTYITFIMTKRATHT